MRKTNIAKPIMLGELPEGSFHNPNSVHHLDDSVQNEHTPVFRRVRLEYIRPNPEQPRLHVDQEFLERMVQDVKANGVESPPVLIGSGNKYISISGHTRIMAAKALGWKDLICQIHPRPLKEWTRTMLALRGLAENILRADLTDLEKALALTRLTDKHGLSLEVAALETGIPYATARGLMLLVRDSTPQVLRKKIRQEPKFYTVGRVKTILEPVRSAVQAGREVEVEALLDEAAKNEWPASRLKAAIRKLSANRGQKSRPSKSKMDMQWGSVLTSSTAKKLKVAIDIDRRLEIDEDAVGEAIKAFDRAIQSFLPER